MLGNSGKGGLIKSARLQIDTQQVLYPAEKGHKERPDLGRYVKTNCAE